jgi:DNA-binding transcriptional LysR family regulator
MRSLTDFDLRLLQVFRTVVECGGFTAAESELNVSRSTISVHISNLEKRLKVRLAQRGRQGFALTAEGQAIYSAVLELGSSLGDFAQVVADLNASLTGELTILTADQLDGERQAFLSEVLAEVHEQAPGLTPALDLMPLQHIELALLKDQAHAAFMPGYRQIEGLVYIPAFTTPVYLCCASNHPLFDEATHPLSEDRLQQFSVIHPGLDINPEGRRLLQNMKAGAHAYQFDTRLAMILSGAWIGFIPGSLAQPLVDAGRLRLINPETHVYPFAQFFVYKRQPREAKRVELIKSIVDSKLAPPAT